LSEVRDKEGRSVGAALFLLLSSKRDRRTFTLVSVRLPLLFRGNVILVTTMLGFLSGWFNLQQWYADDGNEEPLLKLRWQCSSTVA
jgi:hypothetical protein